MDGIKGRFCTFIFTTDGAPSALKEQKSTGDLLKIRVMSASCDKHALSLGLVNGCYASFGVKGDMFHAQILQFGPEH